MLGVEVAPTSGGLREYSIKDTTHAVYISSAVVNEGMLKSTDNAETRERSQVHVCNEVYLTAYLIGLTLNSLAEHQGAMVLRMRLKSNFTEIFFSILHFSGETNRMLTMSLRFTLAGIRSHIVWCEHVLFITNRTTLSVTEVLEK